MAGLGGLGGLVGILPFNFVVVCTPCAFFGMSGSRRFKRAFAFVYSFSRSQGGACFLLKEFEADNCSMS